MCGRFARIEGEDVAAISSRFELGTVAASEAVLTDLYVGLRRVVAQWAAVTQQTPQARMGYVGQHLTSVVTGYPGGRSGARGKDLLLPDAKFAEIKTCYRVDQLGVCSNCGHAVASIELECPNCGSDAIDRKDDSKWLLTPKSEEELAQHWDAEAFYLVLFDFADFSDPREINARIWEVDPRSRGFAYMLVDYFFNIRARSSSKAPFNLWPFSFKFSLLGGQLIYSARIHEDDSIETLLFPGELGDPEPITLGSFLGHARSRALTDAGLRVAAQHLGLDADRSRPELLSDLEEVRDEAGEALRLALTEGAYGRLIEPFRQHLPNAIRQPYA